MLHFQLLLRRRALAAALACVFVSLLSPSAAWSQAWPSKTVKIVVPRPPITSLTGFNAPPQPLILPE